MPLAVAMVRLPTITSARINISERVRRTTVP
jgi:hypothetical protein